VSQISIDAELQCSDATATAIVTDVHNENLPENTKSTECTKKNINHVGENLIYLWFYF